MAARIIFALLHPSGQSTSKTFGFLVFVPLRSVLNGHPPDVQHRFARQISPETNAHASMAFVSGLTWLCPYRIYRTSNVSIVIALLNRVPCT